MKLFAAPWGVKCDGDSTFPSWGSDRHNSHPAILPSAPWWQAKESRGLQCLIHSPILSFIHLAGNHLPHPYQLPSQAQLCSRHRELWGVDRSRSGPSMLRMVLSHQRTLVHPGSSSWSFRLTGRDTELHAPSTFSSGAGLAAVSLFTGVNKPPRGSTGTTWPVLGSELCFPRARARSFSSAAVMSFLCKNCPCPL